MSNSIPEKFLTALRYEVSPEERGFFSASQRQASGKIDRIHISVAHEVGRDPDIHAITESIVGKKGARGGTGFVVVSPEHTISEETKKLAHRNRVALLRESEFCDRVFGLDDLAASVRKQLEAGDFSEIKRTYTEQDALRNGQELAISASKYVRTEWLSDRSAQILVMLAPAGHGKTTLSRLLAHDLVESYSKDKSKSCVPLLIPFSQYRRLISLRALILEFLDEHGHLRPMEAVNSMISQGRILLILDGFDELCEQAGLATARDNLTAFGEGIRDGGRIVLTSRTAFFRTNIEGRSIVQGLIEKKTPEIVELQPFTDPQRRDFLGKLSKNEDEVGRVCTVIEKLPLLEELAGSPYLLKQLHSILRGEKNHPYKGNGNVASIYAWMLDRMCERERDRQAHGLSNTEQTAFLKEIARYLYEDTSIGDAAGKVDRLEAGTVSFVVAYQFDERIKKDSDPDNYKDRLAKQLINHALLTTKGTEADTVQFIHHTWKDFLLSQEICDYAKTVRLDDLKRLMNIPRPIPEWVTQFCGATFSREDVTLMVNAPQLKDPRVYHKVLGMVTEFCRAQHLTSAEEQSKLFFSVVGHNAFKNRTLRMLRLSGLDFREESFEGSELHDCTFDGSDLSKANFGRCVVRNCSFEECVLTEADFRSTVDLALPLRQQLHDMGALVEMTGVVAPPKESPSELANKLVISVLEKFRDSSEKKLVTLRRGVEPKWRSFVMKHVVPILEKEGFVRSYRNGVDWKVERVPSTNSQAWAFLDRGDLSDDIRKVIEEVERRLH